MSLQLGDVLVPSIADVLAARRLVRLAVEDDIAEPLREWVWKYDPPEKRRLGYVLTCRSCSSVWLSAAVLSYCMPRVLRDTLALSEAVILLSKAEDSLK